MELLQIFDNFKLNDLNDKWVNTVWDSQFLTYEEPPQDDYFLFIESEDMDLLLQNTCEVVKDWLAEIHTSEECNNKKANVSWDVLVSLNINVHALLSVLYYIIKSGQRDEANKTSKQTCLSATSLYFMLLAIPGSHAFNIFHPNLYKKAIESLKLCKLLIPIITKGNKTVTLEYMDINEDQSSDHVISLSEKVLLIEGVKSILSNFIIMIKLFSFRTYSHSLDITISVLLEVTDVNQFEYQKTRNKLFCNAYTALFKLCDNKHGSIKGTIMMIAKYIHPRFLFNHNDHQIKFIANMHELTINFLRKLLDTYEKEAKIAIMTLIQYIMIKCPERQEARQKQATVLLKLITICKEDIIIHIINDIISLSHHTKVSCRLFAQEIIGKLLIESNLNNHDLKESFQWKKIKKALIATTLSRCMDSSNMVRGRAMATIAEFTDIQNNIIEMLVEDTSEVSCSDETLPLFDELRTILIRDVNPMPTLNTVLIMLIDRVEDERALVRRSALQILKNLTIKFPILTCQVAPIVGRRCRDPVMTVRRFAIHILSVILEYFPNDSQILNEWVETVLPQIFDTEIKVQEKALESFQDLLISKITNHSNYTDNAKSSLPWRIVGKLTDMKMMKHLSRACKIWIKNNLINNSLITDIQSHIGSDNDTSAWVLLTAISESMKLPNLNKYIDDYKDLIQKNNYHSNLILQILRNSWSSLSKNDMKDLYEYLYQCLCDFKIHFGLISICLDIIGGIIKHLYPDDNKHLVQSNAMKLMEISELKIQKMLKINNKTIDTSNYIKAMSTLGHVAFSCTNKLSSSTLRILEGLLLESELLPDSIKEVKELQAFAVVVLGQHAIRDHGIAQEVIPILGRLLRMDINHNSSTEIAIKVNAAKALADLCIRFTTLVEPYLSDMCICMKDRSSIVREAVVVIFIQLLLEDFIKVKGPFFFHILTMLFDPDKMIRELTIFLIEERLLKKNKVLISQKFLESIYHYNNYQFKHKLCDRKMRKEEKEMLTFPGNKNHDNRAIIYNFMIEHLDPPEKIKLLVKLTTQILGRVSNGTINVTSQKGACVLKDTLYILNNERLQPFLSSNKHAINSQDQEDFMSPSDVLTTNALTVIIEGMKRHGLEILLPTLLKIKEKLEILKSPLKHDVMRFVSRMYTIYSKEHLTNLLNEYPQLEKEIDQYKRNVDKDANIETDNVDIQNNLALLKNGTENLKTNVQLSIGTRVPKVILHRISPKKSDSYIFSQESNPSTSTPKLSDRSYDRKRDYILSIKCTKRSSHSQEMTLNHKVIKNSTVQIESDNDSE
ncbi:condensin-2 complex subunit D3-like isoform X1 [Vespula squamosa]|uniref:Condensin-2 complex subunit D3-like isoform X1 n=1 Tax=Vespula squamosa TaxID=30214 RepID=A0ABD2B3J4_VESSQ